MDVLSLFIAKMLFPRISLLLIKNPPKCQLFIVKHGTVVTIFTNSVDLVATVAVDDNYVILNIDCVEFSTTERTYLFTELSEVSLVVKLNDVGFARSIINVNWVDGKRFNIIVNNDWFLGKFLNWSINGWQFTAIFINADWFVNLFNVLFHALFIINNKLLLNAINDQLFNIITKSNRVEEVVVKFGAVNLSREVERMLSVNDGLRCLCGFVKMLNFSVLTI